MMIHRGQTRTILRYFATISIAGVMMTEMTFAPVVGSEDEGEPTPATFRETYPLSGLVVPLLDVDPQHRSHTTNGWSSAYLPDLHDVSSTLPIQLAPPTPPRIVCLPGECCEDIAGHCYADEDGKCCSSSEDSENDGDDNEGDVEKTEDMEKERDYRRNSYPDAMEDATEACSTRPSPMVIQPPLFVNSRGSRVTIQGSFLGKSINDITEVLVCGMICSDVREEEEMHPTEPQNVGNDDGDPGEDDQSTVATSTTQPDGVPCWMKDLDLNSDGVMQPTVKSYLYRHKRHRRVCITVNERFPSGQESFTTSCSPSLVSEIEADKTTKTAYEGLPLCVFVKDGKIENATSIESDESVAEKEIEDADVEDIEAERDIFPSDLIPVNACESDTDDATTTGETAGKSTDGLYCSLVESETMEPPSSDGIFAVDRNFWRSVELPFDKRKAVGGSPADSDPRGLPAGYKSYLDARGHKYYANPESDEPSRYGHPSLPPGWSEAVDEAGRTYYWKRGTKETRRPILGKEGRVDDDEFVLEKANSTNCPDGCQFCSTVPMGGEECYEPCEEGYTFHRSSMAYGSCKKEDAPNDSGAEDEDASVESSEESETDEGENVDESEPMEEEEEEEEGVASGNVTTISCIVEGEIGAPFENGHRVSVSSKSCGPSLSLGSDVHFFCEEDTEVSEDENDAALAASGNGRCCARRIPNGKMSCEIISSEDLCELSSKMPWSEVDAECCAGFRGTEENSGECAAKPECTPVASRCCVKQKKDFFLRQKTTCTVIQTTNSTKSVQSECDPGSHEVLPERVDECCSFFESRGVVQYSCDGGNKCADPSYWQPIPAAPTAFSEDYVRDEIPLPPKTTSECVFVCERRKNSFLGRVAGHVESCNKADGSEMKVTIDDVPKGQCTPGGVFSSREHKGKETQSRAQDECKAIDALCGYRVKLEKEIPPPTDAEDSAIVEDADDKKTEDTPSSSDNNAAGDGEETESEANEPMSPTAEMSTCMFKCSKKSGFMGGSQTCKKEDGTDMKVMIEDVPKGQCTPGGVFSGRNHKGKETQSRAQDACKAIEPSCGYAVKLDVETPSAEVAKQTKNRFISDEDTFSPGDDSVAKESSLTENDKLEENPSEIAESGSEMQKPPSANVRFVGLEKGDRQRVLSS